MRPLLILSILCLMAGCAFQQSHSVPPWIFKPPQSDKYIYSVGSSGKSLSPWESKEIALKDALVRLAQSVNTQVMSKAVRKVYAGNLVGGAKMLKTSTDTALKRAAMVEFWADPQGRAGLGYRVYILMRVEKKYLQDL